MNQTLKRELASGTLGVLALGAVIGIAHAPLAVAGGFAIAAYVGGRLLFRGDDAVIRREEEHEALVAKGKAQAGEFIALASKIADPVLGERVRHLGERTRQIFEEIAECPEKAGDACSLTDVYLPRALEIVRRHIRLTGRKGIVLSAEDLREAEDLINVVADVLKDAHHKLFREEIAELSIQSETLRRVLEISEPDLMRNRNNKDTEKQP